MSQLRLFPPLSPEIKSFRKGKKPATSKQISTQSESETSTSSVSKTPEFRSGRSTARNGAMDKNFKPWTSPASSITLVNPTPGPGLGLLSSSSNTDTNGGTGTDIPMQSIFPRYNPNIPRSEQEYYPRFPASTPRSSGRHNKPFPRISDEGEGDVQFSSTGELQGLWDAANGQRLRGRSKMESYRLRLARTDLSTFTFGHSSQPFYTLTTTNHYHELTLSRANPAKQRSRVPIMTINLPPGQTQPNKNDSLITHLFSRLAGMLASEQARECSKQKRLDPIAATQEETRAVRSAKETEECSLRWDGEMGIYELGHPGLGRRKQGPGQQALVGAVTQLNHEHTEKLHIAVTTSSRTTDHNHIQSSIRVTAPTNTNNDKHDQNELLASLDLSTNTLSINAAAIIPAIPSLYAIDVVVAAVLAVGFVDRATRDVLREMKIEVSGEQEQVATDANAPVVNNGGREELVTTKAERDDAAAGSDLVAQVKSAQAAEHADNTNAKPRPWNTFRSWFRPKSKPPKTTKYESRKIVIEEFDLGKYTRRGPGSTSASGLGQEERQGRKQELPRATRGVLKFLFWGLDVVVRVLVLSVRGVAWSVVVVSRCVFKK